MTVKELYEWAKNHNAEDLEIGVQYQDAGGCYGGNTFENCHNIDMELCHVSRGKWEEDYVLIG